MKRCLVAHSNFATRERSESHKPVAAQSVSAGGTTSESRETIGNELKEVTTTSTIGRPPPSVRWTAGA